MAECTCASALRHRVELQSVSTSRDIIGGLVETWAAYATVWAEVRQASGREIWYRQQMNAQAAWTVGIRYRADVTTKHRVAYGSRTFEIRSVIDPEQRRRFLMIGCDEIVAP